MDDVLNRRQFLARSLAVAAAVPLGVALQPWTTVRAQGFGGGGVLISVDDVFMRLQPAFSDCPVSTAAMLQELRVLDARAMDAYAAGHILTAASLGHEATSTERDGVPSEVADVEQLAPLFRDAGLHPDLELIVYSDQGNLYSGWLYWLLDYHGYRNVRVMDGGVAAWTGAAGYPLTEETREFDPAEPQLQPDPSKRVEVDWVEAHLGDPSVTFVDARSADSYASGHIPGAVSAPWRGNIDWETERFLPTTDLIRRYRELGVRAGNTIVTYCQLGVVGAHDYLALKLLGYPDVRLYDGSYAEWTQDPSRPVEASDA